MGYGKSIGGYLVDIIKAEKRKLCNVLILVCVITQKIDYILKVN